MKKLLCIILALLLAVSVLIAFSACGKKEDTDEKKPSEVVTSDEEEADSKTQPETEPALTEPDSTEPASSEDDNLPKAGDVITLGGVKVTVPEGWTVKKYTEGEKVEIAPEGAFIDSVELSLGKVYGGERAKEWADNINGNYGGGKEIDQVTIGGKTFYRVKAESEQNICFTDIDDSTYLEISVMFMPWEKGEPVLSSVSFE